MNLGDRAFKEVTSLPFYLGIANRAIKNFSCVDKFGDNPDINSGVANNDIWEEGGVYTFSADGVADIDTISSSSTADTNIILEIDGLDAEGLEITGYAELNGQNKVLIYDNSGLTGDPIKFWRSPRMQNMTGEISPYVAKSITGEIYCYVETAAPLGIPTDKTKIRAKIVDGNNQTQMAIFTIPKGKTGFLIRGDAGMSKGAAAAIIRGQYISRRFGGVFKVKKTFSLMNTGSSVFFDYRTVPDIIPELTDIVIRTIEASANSIGVYAAFQIILIDKT